DEAGFVYVRGRRSEMIKTSHANVAPAEVETVLLAVADIQEAVVFGVPDPRKGEKVVCVLGAKPGCTLDIPRLRLRMKGEISGYKVPEEFLVMPYDTVPRTASGKPVKPKLKEMWSSGGLAAAAPEALQASGSGR